MECDPPWLVLGVKRWHPSRTGIYTTHGRTPSHQLWFYQAISNTTRMETESVHETSQKFHTWMQLSAQEHFTASVPVKVSRPTAVRELNIIGYLVCAQGTSFLNDTHLLSRRCILGRVGSWLLSTLFEPTIPHDRRTFEGAGRTWGKEFSSRCLRVWMSPRIICVWSLVLHVTLTVTFIAGCQALQVPCNAWNGIVKIFNLTLSGLWYKQAALTDHQITAHLLSASLYLWNVCIVTCQCIMYRQPFQNMPVGIHMLQCWKVYEGCSKRDQTF